MRVRPISLNAANKWMADVHRVHKRPCAGWLFGVAILADDGAVIGVAMAGRPKARHLQDGTTVEITRVAALPGHPNACSFAYGALRRAAAALGYRRVYTYTLATEPGISPRAAGFVYDGRRRTQNQSTDGYGSLSSGRGGIRTPGPHRSAIFGTAAISRSATRPNQG